MLRGRNSFLMQNSHYKLLCFLSDLNSRGAQSYSPVHVVNLDIQDNHEEATLGAFLICEMCQAVSFKLFNATCSSGRMVVVLWLQLLPSQYWLRPGKKFMELS